MIRMSTENHEGKIVRTTDGRLFLVMSDQEHRFLAVRVIRRTDGAAPYKVRAPRDERFIRSAGCVVVA